jgi:hypothetical protein
VTNRPHETWHRLRDWTSGQAPSERLSAQILLNEGFVGLDPSHPLGGPDGGKDALCRRDGKKWVMAVYFSRGQQSLGAIKKKFLADLQGVATNEADALAFVTNQEFSLGDRGELREAADPVQIELYHLERVATILDRPAMGALRSRLIISASFARVAPTNRRLTALLLAPRDRMPEGAESSDRS